MTTTDDIRPLGERILVRRYTKPEQVRGFWVPDEARADDTGTLWEVIRAAPAAEERLGQELLPDDILVTLGRSGVFVNEMLPAFDPDVAFVQANRVTKVIRWQGENDEDDSCRSA